MMFELTMGFGYILFIFGFQNISFPHVIRFLKKTVIKDCVALLSAIFCHQNLD